jgi:hypothetical protein
MNDSITAAPAACIGTSSLAPVVGGQCSYRLARRAVFGDAGPQRPKLPTHLTCTYGKSQLLFELQYIAFLLFFASGELFMRSFRLRTN